MPFLIENGILNNYIEEPGVTEITIPDTVTKIGNKAFFRCVHLTSVTIPDTVTSIGSFAFQVCTRLASVNIGKGVKYMGDWVFAACSSLTSVCIPEGVPCIGDRTFSCCTSLTDVTIPGSVMDIAERAFAECTSLKTLVIPEGVSSIGDAAFSGCSALTSVTIPDTVSFIGSHAFRDCSALTELVIPDSVSKLGNYAFYGCKSLKTLTIPLSIQVWGQDPFACSALEYLKLHPEDTPLRRNFAMYEDDIPKAVRMLRDMDLKADIPNTVKFPFIILHYLRTHDADCAAFLREEFFFVLMDSILAGDIVFLSEVTGKTDWITGECVDALARFAHDAGEPEIYLMLVNYKHDKFGFRSVEEQFDL